MSRTRGTVTVLVGIAFFLLGAVWAVSSPPGSSPDDDFHLASIWCAWGESASCLTEAPPGADASGSGFYVPSRLDFQCYVETSPESARCALDQREGWIPGRVDGLGFGGNYPPGFHAAMRTFVGPDIDRSVIAIRVFNSGIASALLVLALLILRPPLRRAVAITWLVGIIPFGLWFIASTNPSSWAIISGGLFWAFFANWLGSRRLGSRNSWLSLAGMAITGLMGAASRSDAALALAVTVVATAVFLTPSLRRYPRRVWLVLAPLPVMALGVAFRLVTLGGLSGIRLGTMGEDQSASGLLAQWVRYTAEFPALVAGMVGAERPDFIQASTYIFGLANQDVLLPSMVQVVNVAALGAVLFWGLKSYNRPKILALGILLISMVILPLVTLSRFDFRNMYQPRYLLPLFLAFIGIALTSKIKQTDNWRRLQAYGLATLVTLSGSASLFAVGRRFTNGQADTWLSFSFAPEWWWTFLPQPVLVWSLGIIALGSYASGLAWLVRAEIRAPRLATQLKT